MLIVAVILFALAVVALTVGILGVTGTLPGNRFFGVTTEAAIADENTFRLANRVAAPTTLVAGVLLGVAGLAALAMGPLVGTAVAVVATATALFTAGSGVSLGAAAAEAMTPADEIGGCGRACGGCPLQSVCRPG